MKLPKETFFFIFVIALLVITPHFLYTQFLPPKVASTNESIFLFPAERMSDQAIIFGALPPQLKEEMEKESYISCFEKTASLTEDRSLPLATVRSLRCQTEDDFNNSR
ncbi:MAG: hypothetical protein ACJAT4_001692 [Granulosicoccus sp.]|jgi:hypothetical protein